MANQNPDSTLQYWFESSSATPIKSKGTCPIGKQNFWYNGLPEGYLLDSRGGIKSRNYAILIGF